MFWNKDSIESSTPQPPDRPPLTETQLALARSRYVSNACIGFMLVLLVFGHVAAASYAAVAAALVWSLGLTSVGLFAGFLFALPRVWQDDSRPARSPLPPSPITTTEQAAPPGSTEGPQAPGATASSTASISSQSKIVRPPDALLEIADWLTKIIVGLGLVNLKESPDLMTRLSIAISKSLPGCHIDAGSADAYQSFGLAMAVFFPVLGLLLGYLLTRIYLQMSLVSGDIITSGLADGSALNNTVIFNPSKVFRESKERAELAAGGKDLGIGMQAPAPEIVAKLAALASRYEHINISDYLARILEKNDVTSQMFQIATQNAVKRGWLSTQSGDAYLYVLATASLSAPTREDVDFLLAKARQALQKHTKYRVAEAFRHLSESGLIDDDKQAAISEILNDYLIAADTSLTGQVQAALNALDSKPAEPAAEGPKQ